VSSTNGSQATGVAVSGNGDRVVATGSFYGTLDFGAGEMINNTASDSLFALWLDGKGDVTRSKAFGNTPSLYGPKAAVDYNGNVIIAGAFDGTLNSDFAGQNLLTDGYDVFALKLTPSGDRAFSAVLEAELSLETRVGVAVDPSGNPIIGASNPAGDEMLLWNVPSQGGAGVAQSYAVYAWRSGLAYGSEAALVTGYFLTNGTTNFGGGPLVNEDENEENAFVAKLVPPL
jgi:hypothetical protein